MSEGQQILFTTIIPIWALVFGAALIIYLFRRLYRRGRRRAWDLLHGPRP